MEVAKDHQSRRNRSIRLAVLTSFLSKGGTILLQLLSLPVAARVLGREEFGLYSTVNLALSTIALLQVGVGPALAHGLSTARAKGDEVKMKALASTAYVLMGVMGLVAGVVLAWVLGMIPVEVLFGREFAGKEASLRPALWLGLGLFLALFVLNLTERIREGLLETAVNNVWGAVGNGLAALAVGVGIWWVPEVWYLVLAVHGSMVAVKLANTVSLWRGHPEMRLRWGSVDTGLGRFLLTDGLSFSACTLVTGVVEYSWCGWMVGRKEGPEAMALYGSLVSVTVMQLGMVMMVSIPTWTSIAEALARGDREWARKVAERLVKYGAGLGLLAVVGWVVLGPWALGFWLGEEFRGTERSLLAGYAIYLFAHLWRHVQHALVMGTGQVKRLVKLQVAESLMLGLLAWPVLVTAGVGAMWAVNGLLILLFTGRVLPRWNYEALK